MKKIEPIVKSPIDIALELPVDSVFLVSYCSGSLPIRTAVQRTGEDGWLTTREIGGVKARGQYLNQDDLRSGIGELQAPEFFVLVHGDQRLGDQL